MTDHAAADVRFMEEALALAEQGRGWTSPNPVVGAVAVKDGKIVGRGWHEAAGKPHAEVNALNDAGDLAKGATLYVTLEPCHHTGRTPPCTRAILDAGVRRTVAAMADPNPHVTGNGLAFLQSQGVETLSGVCEDAAARLNEAFVKHVVTGRPFVLLKCAATLDGRIATRTGDARWVSGEASRQYVHELRHAMDGIMVGAGTVRADNPGLTARREGRKSKDPVRIILDARLSVSPDAKIFTGASNAATLVVAAEHADEGRKAALEARGAKVLTAPVDGDRIALDPLMALLGESGVTSLLIEGGGRVIAAALAAGIVDKINFFYAPKILGGDDGVPMCRGRGPDLMRDCLPVRDVTARRFGEDVMIEGYLRNRPQPAGGK